MVVQWLRIHLPMQETWVRSLVQEDPTSLEATKPVHRNDWASALKPMLCDEKPWAATGE